MWLNEFSMIGLLQNMPEMAFKEPKCTDARGETKTMFWLVAYLLGWQGQLREVSTLVPFRQALNQEKMAEWDLSRKRRKALDSPNININRKLQSFSVKFWVSDLAHLKGTTLHRTQKVNFPQLLAATPEIPLSRVKIPLAFLVPAEDESQCSPKELKESTPGVWEQNFCNSLNSPRGNQEQSLSLRGVQVYSF